MNNKDFPAQISALIQGKKYEAARSRLASRECRPFARSKVWLNMLGVCERGLGRPAAAVQAYVASLGSDSSQAGIWSNLGNAYKDLNKLEAAMRCHQIASTLSGGKDPLILHNMGISTALVGDHAQASTLYEQALALNPAREEIWWDLARSQLARFDYTHGWDNYKRRWNFHGAGPRRFSDSEWSGESLDGKTLLVYAEQGFGDYIQCVRFINALARYKAARILLEVKPELKALVSHAVAGLSTVQCLDYPVIPEAQAYDYCVSIVDLPGFFARDYTALSNDCPYLRADDTRTLNVGDTFRNDKLKVGIVWSGSTTFARNEYRSTDVKYFIQHLSLPGVKLYSLQMGERKDDLGNLTRVVTPLDAFIHDFSDTVRLLNELDLVISTCTSMVHLCGAIGKECWVLLDYSPHWLWGTDSDRSNWYPSLKLFRQRTPGGWGELFDRVSAQLLERVRP